MTDPAWEEIMGVVEAMIRNLGPLAGSNPEGSVKGDDFNALLERARAAFPQSAAIRDLKQIDGLTTLADLFGKLSIVEGAVKAAFTVRSVEEVETHNARLREQW